MRDLVDGVDEAIDEGQPTCGALRYGEITETFQQRIKFARQSQPGGADVIPNFRGQLNQSCLAKIKGGTTLQAQGASKTIDVLQQ